MDSENLVDGEINIIEKSGDELLIELVRSYPVIYDKTLKDHKNSMIVNNAWSEIGIIMDLPGKKIILLL